MAVVKNNHDVNKLLVTDPLGNTVELLPGEECKVMDSNATLKAAHDKGVSKEKAAAKSRKEKQ